MRRRMGKMAVEVRTVKCCESVVRKCTMWSRSESGGREERENGCEKGEEME